MIVGKSGLHFKAFTSNAFLNVQKMVSKLRFWSSFLRRGVGDSYVSRQFPTFRINNRRSRALFTRTGKNPVFGKLDEYSDKSTPVIGFLAEESDKAANDPAYAPSKAEAFMQLMEIEINLIS